MQYYRTLIQVIKINVSKPRPKRLLKTDRWTELMDKVDTIGNDIEEMKSFT